MKVRLHPNSDRYYSFICPGCGDTHTIKVKVPEDQNGWTFNGDVNNPTFQPSLLVRSGHYAYDHKPESCWCTYNEAQKEKGEPESSFTCYRCHSYITNGQIQFLAACTHALAGQTVPLPEMAQS